MTFDRFSRPLSALALSALAVILAACAAAAPSRGKETEGVPTPTPQRPEGETLEGPGSKLASITRVEMRILESFPVQVHALIEGDLADGCTEIAQIEQQRDIDGKAFHIAVSTTRDPDKICTQALVPFEEIVPLDVRDLPVGTYSVDVNGVRGEFELQTDNSIS